MLAGLHQLSIMLLLPSIIKKGQGEILWGICGSDLLLQHRAIFRGHQIYYKSSIPHIATLDLEERLILEDGPSGLIKSDLTNHPPTPTHPRADGLFRSNHWSDLIQMLNLDLDNQSKVFYIQNEDYLIWKTTSKQ